MKVIVYNLFGTGHVQPTLPLVRELTAGGARVIYHSTPARRALIEACGAEFRNYGYDAYQANDFNPGKNVALALLPAARGLWPHLAREVEREAPDLIVYDSMAPWGLCLARRYGVPALCTVTTFALSLAARRRMLRLNRLEIDACNLEAVAALEELSSVRLDPADALGCYGDHNLVFGAAALNPPPFDRDARAFCYVGPMIDEPAPSALDDFLHSGRDIVYVAAGSILGKGDHGVDNVTRAALAVAAADPRLGLVISAGPDGVAALGALPANCVALPYVPQLEVLRRAKGFITHAGANSVNEGAWFGVPMLAIPQCHDQFQVADRVVEAGLGVQLAAHEVTPTTVRRGLDVLLSDPNVARSCRRMRDAMRACPGMAGVRDALSALLPARAAAGSIC